MAGRYGTRRSHRNKVEQLDSPADLMDTTPDVSISDSTNDNDSFVVPTEPSSAEVSPESADSTEVSTPEEPSPYVSQRRSGRQKPKSRADIKLAGKPGNRLRNKMKRLVTKESIKVVAPKARAKRGAETVLEKPSSDDLDETFFTEDNSILRAMDQNQQEEFDELSDILEAPKRTFSRFNSTDKFPTPHPNKAAPAPRNLTDQLDMVNISAPTKDDKAGIKPEDNPGHKNYFTMESSWVMEVKNAPGVKVFMRERETATHDWAYWSNKDSRSEYQWVTTCRTQDGCINESFEDLQRAKKKSGIAYFDDHKLVYPNQKQMWKGQPTVEALTNGCAYTIDDGKAFVIETFNSGTKDISAYICRVHNGEAVSQRIPQALYKEVQTVLKLTKPKPREPPQPAYNSYRGASGTYARGRGGQHYGGFGRGRGPKAYATDRYLMNTAFTYK